MIGFQLFAWYILSLVGELIFGIRSKLFVSTVRY